jgi:putative ABC transport system permease protein
MLRDQVAAAFRSLMNSKFYATINIVGLATSFAVAVLLSLYVHDELTYDHFFPASTYRLSSAITLPGGHTTVFDGTDYVAAQALKLDIPQVQTTARMMPQEWTVRNGDIKGNETIYWSDPTLFAVLPMHAVAGDLKTALEEPNSLVLTRSMARKYFGMDKPLGKILQLNQQHAVRVTAIVNDLPSNTHVAAQIFGSANTPFSNLAQMDATHDSFHFDGTTYTYFTLRPGASLDSVRAALPSLVVNRLHIPEHNAFGVAVQLSAIPVHQIHFSPAGVNAMKAPGDRAIVWAAGIIAILILAGACVNFINLSTARVARRALEVGVRKANGASRSILALQFLAEALLQVGAGMLIALAAVELLLPAYNAFLQRDIAFHYWQPAIAGFLILLVLGVGFLAGSYPAFVLSSLSPAVAVRGGPTYLNRGVLRQILVVLQFAILTALVIATVIMWWQTNFAANSAARLRAENMVLISAPCIGAVKDSLANEPAIDGVTCSQPMMISSDAVVEMMETSPQNIHSFDTLSVEPGFLESYGIKPVAGRLFDRAQGDIPGPPAPGAPQTLKAVINETALHDLGLSDPNQAIGMRLQASAARGMRFFTIIGVVPDFPTGSVRVPVAPTAYVADPSRYAMLSAKVKPGRMAEATSEIREAWMASGQPGLPKMLPLDLYAASLYRDISRAGTLFAIAAAVALFIALTGLFGMATFIAEQRTKEIGIRKAMGATTAQVSALLLWRFVKPVLWANLIAWPIVWWLMRGWLDEFAYHVPLNLWPFVSGGAFTLVVTVLTVAGHAYLVARQPPAAALRYE